MRCARLVSVLTAGALVAVMSACGSSPGSGEGSAEKPDPAKPVVVLAAGDIACDPDSSNFRDGQGTPTACAQMATSDIAMAINPDALLALGDIQYGDGRLDDYEKSFVKSWGRLRSVLHPVPGNQEYRDDAAAAVYFAHFGQLAGVSGQGYYSFASAAGRSSR